MGLCTYHLTLSTLLLLVLLIGLPGSAVVQAQNTYFSFTSFTTADRDSFLMVDDVQYDAGNSSFLMNSNGNRTFSGTCGRLLYKDKVRMKDSASGAVASFHTTFTFQISGLDLYRNADVWYHGDGIAFTFARANTFLNESGGASFCLRNNSESGLLSNHFFAVEFDTYLNPEVNDSSDSHIGVDINSVSSTWSFNLCSGRNVRNCQYLCNGGYFTAWIDYDSSSQNLQVYFANGSLYNNIPKPPMPLINASLASTIPFADLVDDYMYVGFSGSTGLFSEVHQIQSWEFTSYGLSELGLVSHGRKDIAIIAVVSVAVVAALLIGLCFVFVKCTICWKRRFSFRHFTYRELSRVTNSFSGSRLLGYCGCRAVYKGIFPSGAKVAVKLMRKRMEKRCYLADIADLSDLHHRNLVQLQGWCHEKNQMLLVYDYMCNGSLDEWLYRRSSKQNGKGLLSTNNFSSSLMLRHSILSDVAAALSYLHEDYKHCVLHRNIKSSNVLLDGDWNAYLGDFGLACLFGDQEEQRIVRTTGYIAPELLDMHEPSTKESDVYSFGVLMLEVMCGREPFDKSANEEGGGLLVDRVWHAHEAGNLLQVADSRFEAFLPSSDAKIPRPSDREIELQEAILVFINDDGDDIHSGDQSMIYAPDAATVDKKLIRNLLHLGLLCCSPNPEDRPSMGLVSQLLHSSEYMETSLSPLPECKPKHRYIRSPQGNNEALEKFVMYLKLAGECTEAVQNMSNSWKFNKEQCGYLTDKLKLVVQSASLFLKRPSTDSTRLIESFKLLVALANQIESFVRGCCKDAWIQAAITLSNVSEYVSSLGFNLELCKVAFCKDCAITGCLDILVEVRDMNRAEMEIVEQKASLDVDALIQKVAMELNSLDAENKDLAKYLLQRLMRVGPNPGFDDGSSLGKLFDWVVSEEQLGRGASATVHKARWLGIPVAKKTFCGLENSDFLKEVQILSQLCHPNITSMFCCAKDKWNCSIIMELMDGDLHEFMQMRCMTGLSHPFTILEAVDIMLQIGEGVNYLHKKGIVHRDLKSMNILVKNMEAKDVGIGYVHAKVTDFGLSKVKDKSKCSRLTPNTGTSRWMPPEVMTISTNGFKSWLSNGDTLPKYPFKCDTYSFGMVCYEILTGCVPFSNLQNIKDIKKKVMEANERPILPHDCLPKLKALIERCWSREPKERPTFDTICSELKYLKCLLIIGNDSELASVGSMGGDELKACEKQPLLLKT